MKQPVNERKIHITELIVASIVLAIGIFLTLTSLDLFPFMIEDCWLITTYAGIFVVSLVVMLMQKNAIGCGATFAMLSLLIAQIFVLNGLSFRQIYPLYVLALPLGVLSAMCFIKRRGAIFGVAAAFVGMSLLLLIESFSILSIKAVLPIIVAYFGILGIIYSYFKLKHSRENK